MKSNEIIGLKLIGWQNTFAKMFTTLKENDKLIIKASRQKGKSTVLCQALLYCALNHPRSKSYFVSPTNKQCKKQFDEIKQYCLESPLVSKMNESSLEVKFVNSSSIIFLSAESGDNLRGNTVPKGGILCIDEAAFIKDDTITAVLLPYITVSKAPIVLISTPRRKNGVFYNWYKLALDGAEGYKYIDVNSFDNSFFISESQIEDYRKIMSPEKFKNEILGQFSEENEGVFGDFTQILKNPELLEPKYIGIDWSTTGADSTVVVGFNKYKQQCLIWKDKSLDPLRRVEAIADLLNKYNTIEKVVVEKNSIGAVYSSVLKSKYKNSNIIEEFVTSNSSKKEIIEELIKLIGEKDITLIPDEEQLYQMSIFVQADLSNGNYTYYADPKAQNSHDDIVMATAFAIKAISSEKCRYSFGISGFKKY